MNDDLKKYRDYLVTTEQKVSESYDKTVIALSSGALGISFAFLKDVIGPNKDVDTRTLLGAWVFLTLSLSSVVLSLMFGTIAFRKTIDELDAGTLKRKSVGGWQADATGILHVSGAVLLIVGLFLLGIFLIENL